MVLLHGFLEDGAIWNQLAAELRPNFRLIMIDLPGFGRSAGRGYYHTMDSMAEAVMAVVDGLQIQSFHLFGHSMGGYVTLAVAEKWPQRLASFGLLHSTPLPDSAEKLIDRERAIAAIKADLPLFCSITIPNLFAEANRPACLTEIKDLVDQASMLRPRNVVAALRGMMARPDRTHVLVQAKVPCLFLQGDIDPVVPVLVYENLRQLAPKAQFHLLPNVGHMGFFENPKDFNRVVLDFLSKAA